MFTLKHTLLRKTLFVCSDYILFNAVFITALLMYMPETFPFNARFIALLYNIAIIPAVYFLMPIFNRRTLYQEQTALISLKAVTVQIIGFMLLLWIADIEFFSFLEGFVFYAVLNSVISISMMSYRLILKRYRRRGSDTINVLIIGDGETAMALEDEFIKNTDYGYNIKGYIGSDTPRVKMKSERLGNFDDIQKLLEKGIIDEIYYIPESDNTERLNSLIRLSRNNFITFNFVPVLGALSRRKFVLSENFMGVLSLTFPHDRLQNPFNKLIKRIFDIVFSSLVLIILAIPVFIPVSIAVKLSSPGPVFFRQKRNGYHGREFLCYKFRSMVVNKDSDTLATDRTDSRITKIGKFIRKTSIDELPQFLNVLLGDMSVVGPRPHIIKQTESYRVLLDNYMIRHLIKPGITGWAQINRLRGTTDTLEKMEERVKADIWYIDNWSLALDIKIILRTVYNVLFVNDDNAY